MRAVSTPIGMRPALVSMTLVIRSAPTTIDAPTIAEPMRSVMCLGPMRTRTMWGLTKPTKPIGPARTMEMVVRMPAPTSWVIRTLPMRRPTLLASSTGRAPAS